MTRLSRKLIFFRWMRKFFGIGLTTVFVFIGSAQIIPDPPVLTLPLIWNGSFEFPRIQNRELGVLPDHWSADGTVMPGVIKLPSLFGNLQTPTEGLQFLALNSSRTVYQQVTLTIGHQYLLTFDWSPPQGIPGVPPPEYGLMVSIGDATQNTSESFSVPGDTQAWSHEQIAFLPTNTGPYAFSFLSRSFMILLDDVRLVEVPEPISTILLLAGLMVIWRRLRRSQAETPA